MTPAGLTGCMEFLNGTEIVMRRAPPQAVYLESTGADEEFDCLYECETPDTACQTVRLRALFAYTGEDSPARAFLYVQHWNQASFDAGNWSPRGTPGTWVEATAATDGIDWSNQSTSCVSGGATLAITGGGAYAPWDGVVFPPGCAKNVSVRMEVGGYTIVFRHRDVASATCPAVVSGNTNASFNDCGELGVAHRYPQFTLSLSPAIGATCPDGAFLIGEFYFTGAYTPCIQWQLEAAFGFLRLALAGQPPIGPDGMPLGPMPVVVVGADAGHENDPVPVITFERVLP